MMALGHPVRAHPRRLPRRRARRVRRRRAATREPTLLYLGRLKQYKRLEILLDVLEGIPGRDAGGRRRRRPPPGAGGGDRRAAGCDDRVALHGFVAEEREARALRARLGEPDRLLGRGLVPDGHGGRGAPGRRARRWPSAGCRSRSSTSRPALLADTPEELAAKVARAGRRPGAPRRARRRRPRPRPRLHVGRDGRRPTSRCSTASPARSGARLRDALRALGDRRGGGPGRGDAGQQRDPARLRRGLHAPARRRRLRRAGRDRLGVPDPDGRRAVDPGRRRARGDARPPRRRRAAARDAATLDARSSCVATVVAGASSAC